RGGMRPEGRPLTLRCSAPSAVQVDTVKEVQAPGTGIDVWFSRLDALRPRIEEFTAILDRDEIARSSRFRFDVDRERFLLGHGLLRWILGMYTDRRPDELIFHRGRFGKPFLQDTRIQFNMSDTKDAVAVGVTADIALGVDIETLSRSVDHEAVSEHYFTPEEVAAMKQAEDPKLRFLEFWTRKEAVLKASAVGIMDDLRVLRVDAPENVTTIRHEAFMEMAAPAYDVGTWHIGTEHIVSMAVPEAERPVRFLGPA
ncbi:MAG: 4'-phosphopantetheinyl transferase superfamily protein, partial [Flavobacteriales bacterium]|nr:4'-phosphopantetheinyl transferase superfamily protein [Flavobacteriales bacterium]